MILRTEKLIPFFVSLSHDSNGKAVLYDGSLDGEKVEVVITESKKDFCKAEIDRILEASSDRVEPICPHFGICGGCDLLYMTRKRECEEKEKAFRGFFAEFPEVRFLPPVFPDRERSRIRAAFCRNGKAKGFFQKASHDVVNIGCCPLLDPALNAILADLPESGKVVSDDFLASDAIDVAGFRYHVGNDVFFQSNAESAAALLEFVVRSAGDAAHVLDIYAGVGFFSKALECKGRTVVAVEENPKCLRYARKNLKSAAYHNVKAEDAGYLLRNSNPGFAVIDPPRAGMTDKAFEVVSRLKPARIVYVSCAIDKSIRDIRRFADCGYRVSEAQLFDMAPATRHIETACLLERL
ncbi:MAG TPA: hypothetical protein DCO86_03140 [Spirochaetaceae bacterium]|nr:hypothetical protein [Spirochaetaceae bacterium]